MGEKRYALLVASSASFAGEPGQEIPSESLSASLDLIRESITGLDNYSFGWPDENTGEFRRPLTLTRSSWANFLGTLERYRQYIDSDTLFLFYYFGHGVVHENQLHVAFGDSQVGNADKRTLSAIVDELYRVGARNLIIIADNCHAGLARQDFRVQRDGLQYFVLAASRTGYTRYDRKGGQWTLALSQTLERWRRPAVIDRGLGYGTFRKWFDCAREWAQEGTRLAPLSLDGGLADHVLFAVEHRIPSQVLGRRTERTIYNRLYLLLRMLEEQPQSIRELQTRIQDQAWRVFLIASATDSENSDRYISLDAINRYLTHATQWQLTTRDGSGSQHYRLTAQGQEALAQSGSQLTICYVSRFIGTWTPTALAATFLSRQCAR
jgi:hypothetical protein